MGKTDTERRSVQDFTNLIVLMRCNYVPQHLEHWNMISGSNYRFDVTSARIAVALG
jgi:hypothetical protein